MSCAVCGLETCEGACAQPLQSPEQRLRQGLKKAEQLSPGDTLPDYEDDEDEDEDDTADADVEPGEP